MRISLCKSDLNSCKCVQELRYDTFAKVIVILEPARSLRMDNGNVVGNCDTVLLWNLIRV